MKKPKVAVVGAGIMGLTAALELLKDGYNVTIFEKDDQVGGMSASFDFNGLTIERYYHFICKPDTPYFDLLKELGIYNLLKWKDTKMGFFYDDKLYKWGNPLYLLTFPKITLISKFRYAFHIFSTSRIKKWDTLDKLNAVPWLKKSVGENAYNILWKRLFDLKFHRLKDNLSAAWIGTRIKRLGLSRKNFFTERLGYLEGGSNTLFTKIVDKILHMGGRLFTNSELQKIIIKKNKVQGVVVNEKDHSFDIVASTVPIPYIEKIAPGLPSELVNQYRRIDNIGIVCPIIKLKHKITGNFWMNINDKRIDIPGIIEYSNLRPLKVHIVYFPYYLSKEYEKFHQSDEKFKEEVFECFKIINRDFRMDWVIDIGVFRSEYAQPVCPPGFLELLPPINTAIKGLFIADTSYYYPEDRSVSESIRLAKTISKLIVENNS